MKIAFTTQGTNWDSSMDSRFGRALFFVIYNEEKNELTHFDNRDSANDAHGAGPKTAQKLFDLHPDVLITGNGPGESASNALKFINMKIYVDAHNMTARQAYEHYKNGKLREI